MANKFKLFVGFLALIALFSVYSFLNSFSPSSSVTKTANILKNSMSFEVDSDADKDGLTNRDESYWNTDFQNPDSDGDGYLDGEEVASGHDPLIPGPNDFLNNKNLTDKLSKLTLSGLYEGSLSLNHPNYEKNLNTLTSLIAEEAIIIPKIDTSDIGTIESNKENQEFYIKIIATLLQETSLNLIDEADRFVEMLDLIGKFGFEGETVFYFENKRQKFDKVFSELQEVRVPKTWLQNHVYLMELVSGLTETNKVIAMGSEDPIRAATALKDLPNFIERFGQIFDWHDQKRFLKIFLTISIVSAIFVFLFFLSTPDSEAVVTQALRPISCVSGSLLGSALAPEIEKMMNNGINFVSTKLGKILKKTVCERDDAGQCIAKVLGIGGKVPVDDDDTQPKVDSFKNTWRSKENAGDIIARCAAREVLNVMVGNVLNVARTSGRDDGPAWVRNWRNFQTDAQYRGEGMFRAVLSNTKLCDYFNDDVKSLFGATQKVSLTGKQNTRINNFDPFALRANCTMPSNFNLTNYQKDFSGNGGWQAFSRMLEPQNNYYGTLFASLDEAAKQRALEESTDINEAVSGAGFTSRRGDSLQDNCEQTDD